LDEARRALVDAPDDALAALRAYEREFPRGRLAPEAAVTKIEALAAKGMRDRVLTEAARFLRRYPQAPQRARVEELRAEAAGPPGNATPRP
jgi:outer membrane protein assembly factor BamD (BamD/ComL family)